jgi:glycosyltransferase involved in cell wall biosynthesis
MSLRARVRRLLGPGVLRAVAGAGAGQRALMLYTVRAFQGGRGPETHQNIWQQRELARALAERGFEVDVADHDEDRRGLLTRDYDLVMDLHPRARPLFEGRMRPGARRLAYLTGSDAGFGNAAERARLDDLERRRGARLAPRRQCAPLPAAALEACDAALYFGDARTLATYARFRLPPAFRLWNNGYDDVEPTDAEQRDPRRFLFLGGFGQVHKGLDLLLEAFAAEPGLELVVCSPFAAERDFARAYRRELRATPNIRAAGPADVKSARFRELQAGCGRMILPSCSEGQAGSVTVALSYGLPCVVSDRCGFDEPEIEVLADCAVATIRAAARAAADEPRARLRERAGASRGLMERRYRPEHYAASLREALDRALAAPPAGGTR